MPEVEGVSKNPIRAGWSVLTDRKFPLRTRLDLVLASLLRRAWPAGRPIVLPVHVSGGVLYFDPQSQTTDYATFEDIFRQEAYRTEFGGAAVLDIGAHKGYFGAYALIRGAAVVISYEPDSSNFMCLQRSAEGFHRHGKRWTVNRAAVASWAGEGTLYVNAASWAHSFHHLPGTVGTQRVPVVAFTDIIGQIAGYSRAIVKIDAEGSECDIVLRTPVDAWSHVSEAFIEVHSFSPCTLDQLATHFSKSGFVAIAHSSGSHDVAFFRRQMAARPSGPAAGEVHPGA